MSNFCLTAVFKEIHHFEKKSLDYPFRYFPKYCSAVNMLDRQNLHITHFKVEDEIYRISHVHFLPNISIQGDIAL